MIKFFLIFFLFTFYNSCSSKSNLLDNNIRDRFDLGMKYFENKKYSNAEEEFNYLILNNPGSKLSLDAQYYLAESMFYQQKYDEAILEYNRYSRFSDNPEKIEHAEFKSSESSYLLSNKYKFDQGNAAEIMDKLQVFIEKYPESKYSNQIEIFFKDIRSKLAQKDYEIGRLYLKLEEYNAARIYFNEVISIYYDTEFSDLARIEIIFSLLLQQKYDEAIKQLEVYKDKFLKLDSYELSLKLIHEMKTGNKSLSNYYRLYK